MHLLLAAPASHMTIQQRTAAADRKEEEPTMRAPAHRAFHRREFLKCAAGLPLLLGLDARAANAFPTKLVTIICPYQAGGLTDITSRRLAERLSAIWGQAVIVDNRPGAGGNLGAGLVARAVPDGHTMLVTSYEALMISSAAKLNLGFDPMGDLAPAALIGDVELWFLAPAKAPYSTMREFVDYAKQNPGKINMGSIGIGSAHHLGLLQINSVTGAAVEHVPYKGVSMVQDLVAGNIDVAFSSRLSTAGMVSERKLKILGVVGNRRSTLYPDVPTFADSGLADVIVPYAQAAFVSAKVPTETVAKLNEDIRKVLQEPAVKDKFASEGVVVGTLSPAEFNARMRKEFVAIEQVIAKNNLKFE
jgi:tripartite-type tricarboxylate transporter receptor subunit TctC